MAKLLRTIRKFVCFLRKEDITDIDADRFLTAAGRCRQKALPCFSNEELQGIFAQIDRSTDYKKRRLSYIMSDEECSHFFDTFTSALLAEFLDVMEARKGWKASTRNNRLSCIRSFFKYAAYTCPVYMQFMLTLGQYH